MPEISENRFGKLEEKVKKIGEQLKEVNKNINSLHDSLTSFNTEFERFRILFETAMKENENTKKLVHALEADNRCLKKELKDVKSTVEELNFKAKENEMDIVGIPMTVLPDKSVVAEKLAKALALKLDANDIVSVRNIPVKSGKYGIWNVRFVNKQIRDKVQEVGKKAKLQGKAFGVTDCTTYVYFNDCLPPFTRALLNAAKAIKLSNNYRFLWIKEGKVFLRKKEKDPAIRISTMEDLEVLKK